MARYEQQRSFFKSNFHEFKKIRTYKIKEIPIPLITIHEYWILDIIDLPLISFSIG